MQGATAVDLEIRMQPLDGDICLVELSGEIDVYTCRAARKEFRDLLEASHRHFLLELGRLTFIDSAGLGMLVRFLRRVRDRGGNLVLVGTTPPIQKLLRMTGLDSLFAFASTHEEALRRLLETPGGSDPEDTVLAGPARL